MTGRPGVLAVAHRWAAATPAGRDRYVDLLRVVAMGLVVLGHWLVVAVTDRGGRPTGSSALETVAWAHPLTWVFQVMPLFFAVGGHANTASWSSWRSRGGTWAGWVAGRLTRLLRPTTVFVGCLLLAATAARLAGVDPGQVATAAWLAGIGLWFLVVYLATIPLAPLAVAAHRRYGVAVLAVLAVGAAAADMARLAAGLPYVGAANYVLVWLAVHQLGVAWREGALAGRRAPVLIAGGGAAALVLLTVAGPYPVSMVAVPGAAVQNTAPPTLALLALAGTQLGVVLLLRPVADRWLARSGAWTAVVAANAVAMTVYLWHMVPVVLGAVLLGSAGLLPDAAVGSPAWLAWRLPWLLLLAALMLPLVAAAARWELRGRRSGPDRRRSPAAVTAGAAAACGGLLVLVLTGFAPDGGTAAGLLTYAIGLALLTGGRRHGADGRGVGNARPGAAPASGRRGAGWGSRAAGRLHDGDR